MQGGRDFRKCKDRKSKKKLNTKYMNIFISLNETQHSYFELI